MGESDRRKREDRTGTTVPTKKRSHVHSPTEQPTSRRRIEEEEEGEIALVKGMPRAGASDNNEVDSEEMRRLREENEQMREEIQMMREKVERMEGAGGRAPRGD